MFAEPLWLLAALPALALAAAAYFYGANRRRRLAEKLGDVPTLARLVPPGAAARRRLQAALRLGALGMIAVALAGPQWGVEAVESSSASRSVIIAVDVSLSMLAEDVRPTRLDRAKQELSLLIDELKGARIGIIAFAGEPVVACPLTTDTAAVKQLLAGLGPGDVPVPGTGIGKAIRAGTAALSRYPGSKAIVLLTDGEDHKTDPEGAAEEAAGEGVRLFAIGIGSKEGEPIPLRDANGAVEGYKKDKKGATVVSHLAEQHLSALAEKASGAYYRSTPGASEASEIAKRLAGAPGSEADSKNGTQRRYRSHFFIPLGAALLLLLLEAAVPEAPERSEGASFRTAARIGLLLLLALAPARASAATAEGMLRRGNKLYDREEYEPALKEYEGAAQRSKKDARPVFNAGDALYRLKVYDRAGEAFKAVAESGARPAAREQAYYNLGDSLFQSHDYAGAAAAFRRAASLDPKDEDARRNLAVALRKLKDSQSQKGKSPNKQEQKDKEDKKKDEVKSGGQGDKAQGGGGEQKNPPPQQQPRTRPQDQNLSSDDAERIMRAVADRERARQEQQKQPKKSPIRRPDVEEDW